MNKEKSKAEQIEDALMKSSGTKKKGTGACVNPDVAPQRRRRSASHKDMEDLKEVVEGLEGCFRGVFERVNKLEEKPKENRDTAQSSGATQPYDPRTPEQRWKDLSDRYWELNESLHKLEKKMKSHTHRGLNKEAGEILFTE